ncbi:MAG TPA: Na+/H+ antiporter NhaA, partial [Flavobacterium sp.]|nr:Na+/H+ antiporter NhaA [Flavobacterium sp.]
LLNLGISLGIFGLLLLFQLFQVRRLWPYLIGGIIMWYFMLHSGVHATITGVLVALTIPMESRNGKPAPSKWLEAFLHAPVNLFILPLFALANTAIPIESGLLATLTTPYSVGIAAGLVIGKPLGVLVAGFTAVRTRVCKLPKNAGWRHMTGVGLLAGIGFTMSIFITLLAFDDAEAIMGAKLAILVSSLSAGGLGYFLLSRRARQ